MRKFWDLIFGKLNQSPEGHQEVVKHIIESSMNTSRYIILIVELFEVMLLIASIVKPELFGPLVDYYRYCYIFLFFFCMMMGFVLMSVQNHFSKNYHRMKAVAFLCATVFVIWSLVVSYLDSLSGTQVNPTLYMTMILSIPACMYLTPVTFLSLDIVGSGVMFLILFENAGLKIAPSSTLAHFMIFTVIETIIGLSYIHIRYRYFSNTRERLEATQSQQRVQETLSQAIRSLAHAIDAKDQYTRGHSSRVAEYSLMLAEKMALPKEDQQRIYFMALMHDVGKIGVPDEIINKPEKLTDEEYALVKQHPISGFEILQSITSMPELAQGARWHHERYDGTGYPDKLAGEQIPLEARIIAVADAYDTMTSKRSYRKILPQNVVRKEISDGRGVQFDPYVANCMLELIDDDVNYKMHEPNYRD